MTIHEGGCLCGGVRYRADGAPARASICNCTFCQRRAGSAFGFGAYFKGEQISRSAHSWVQPPEWVEVVQKSALPPRS